MFKSDIVTVIIIYELCFLTLCECIRNNVCKNFEDYRTIQTNPNCWYNADVGASPEKIASRYGFPFENYEVTTKDGYIVKLFRIPHNGSDIDKKRPVVFLQHGIAADGLNWMVAGAKSSAFVFAENGYDVWISNCRGSTYSSKHIKYTVYDPAYWNFSFHEMALYDVPAMLDFIVKKTRQTGGITYVGHSMGSTMSYVYASLLPQEAEKHLKVIISLAPIAYTDHISGIARSLVPFRYLIWDFFTSIGLYGFGPNMPFKLDLYQRLCTTNPFIVLCATTASLFSGINRDEVTASTFPVGFRHFPSGLSLKTLLHYAQLLAAKRRFQAFDYGPVLNQRLYNSSTSLEYPLAQINVPVHLFYGKNDALAKEEDVYYLYKKLKTKKTIMEVSGFAHLDFLGAKHSSEFYQFLLKLL